MRRIEYSSNARKFLQKLDKLIASRIIKKIGLLSENPAILEIKKLKNEEGLFRLRVGAYRVIFELHSEVIYITKIGNRKDIYK